MAGVTDSQPSTSAPEEGVRDDRTLPAALTESVSARGMGHGVLTMGVLALVVLASAAATAGSGRHALFWSYTLLGLALGGATVYAFVLWGRYPDREPGDILPGARHLVRFARRTWTGTTAVVRRVVEARRRAWALAASVEAFSERPGPGSALTLEDDDAEPVDDVPAGASRTTSGPVIPLSEVPVAELPGTAAGEPEPASDAEAPDEPEPVVRPAVIGSGRAAQAGNGSGRVKRKSGGSKGSGATATGKAGKGPRKSGGGRRIAGRNPREDP